MARYVPNLEVRPEELDDLASYTREENQRIGDSFLNPNPQTTEMEVLHEAPRGPEEGWLVNADGVDWNPGGGAGPYTYRDGRWVGLASGMYLIETLDLAGLSGVYWEQLPESCDFQLRVNQVSATSAYTGCQVSASYAAGPTYLAIGYTRQDIGVMSNSTTVVVGTVSDAAAYLSTSAPDLVNNFCGGHMNFVTSPAATLNGVYDSTWRFVTSASLICTGRNGGQLPVTAVGAIKLLRTAGTFTSGKASLYAIPRS